MPRLGLQLFVRSHCFYIAKGVALEDACRMANGYLYIAIKNAVRIGRGLPVTNPLSAIYQDASRYDVLAELQAAIEQVTALLTVFTS
jgi:hypothetical protein